MKERAKHCYEAISIEGFVQQLAVKLVANGYWFYVTGVVPEPHRSFRSAALRTLLVTGEPHAKPEKADSA